MRRARTALEPDEVVALIERCDNYWSRVCLALAFYSESASYGLDERTGARQVGRQTPIERDQGRVARAVLTAPLK